MLEDKNAKCKKFNSEPKSKFKKILQYKKFYIHNTHNYKMYKLMKK